MIKSMTGFGRTVLETDGKCITVDNQLNIIIFGECENIRLS